MKSSKKEVKDLATKEKAKALFSIIVIIILFFALSFIAQKYMAEISLSESRILSATGFMLIAAMESVIAPLNIFPLIPIASGLFGWFLAAIYSTIGWTIGAFLAFILARRYGRPLIKKIASLERLERFEKKFPKKHIFLAIILLRIFIPLDLVSYALGLFSKVDAKIYILATIIGSVPFAFLAAYLGTVPFQYQIIGMIFGGGIILIGGLLLWKNMDRIGEKRVN
jgi:uncharacterized membrane protein YdjX (TVP38/TMEM64 family)